MNIDKKKYILECPEEYFYNILNTMRMMGGGFVKSLVECYMRADPINQRKLKETFYDYFWDYDMEWSNLNKTTT